MAAIKAIETIYKGYRFRSRLEARWAVTFTELGIRWEYEKEGFQTPAGYYLPDFWLPDQHYWIEIKPSFGDFGDSWPDDGDIVGWLIDQPKGAKCFVIAGPPGYTDEVETLGGWSYEAFPCGQPDWPVGAWDNMYLWCRCQTCGSLGLQFEGRSARLPCRRIKGSPCYTSAEEDRDHTPNDPFILKALLAGRQARFEHGENPSPVMSTRGGSWYKRVAGWARKVYGENWEDAYDFEEIEEEFNQWLITKETR